MSTEENHIPLLALVKTLINNMFLPGKHVDVLTKCYGREYVRRHTHKRTDVLKLPSANGLLVLGIDSNDDELTIYNVLPTGHYNQPMDVIKPVLNPYTTHIVVIGNTTGKGPSQLWKITISK